MHQKLPRPLLKRLVASDRDLVIDSAKYVYVIRTLVSKPEFLPLQNDTRPLEYGIIDSLSALKPVLFLEERFGVVVNPEELAPEGFDLANSICPYLRAKQGEPT